MDLQRGHREWATRPADQRYLDLDSLYDFTKDRAQRCEFADRPTTLLSPNFNSEDEHFYLGSSNRLNNWSFGQLCNLTGVPRTWATERTHPTIAHLALDWGLTQSPRPQSRLMTLDDEVLALTSTTYGRIYDYKVVELIQDATAGQSWQIPTSSFSQSELSATTLYASDRDVFFFMVDYSRPIEVEGEKLFRGFFCWNSEVGSTTFGFDAFLFNWVCGNRMVWGGQELGSLRIKHTSGAPDRFANEGRKILEGYAGASAEGVAGMIRANKNLAFDDPLNWVRKNGYKLKEAEEIVKKAKEYDGNPQTSWNLVQGATDIARHVPHQNLRIEAERKASKMLVAA